MDNSTTIYDDKEFWDKLKKQEKYTWAFWNGQLMGMWMETHIATVSKDLSIESPFAILPPEHDK